MTRCYWKIINFGVVTVALLLYTTPVLIIFPRLHDVLCFIPHWKHGLTPRAYFYSHFFPHRDFSFRTPALWHPHPMPQHRSHQKPAPVCSDSALSSATLTIQDQLLNCDDVFTVFSIESQLNMDSSSHIWPCRQPSGTENDCFCSQFGSTRPILDVASSPSQLGTDPSLISVCPGAHSESCNVDAVQKRIWDDAVGFVLVGNRWSHTVTPDTNLLAFIVGSANRDLPPALVERHVFSLLLCA